MSASGAVGTVGAVRSVTRDLRRRMTDPPSSDLREYRPMNPRDELEHLVKHVLSDAEAWADVTGRVTGFDRGWYEYAVAIKENRRDRRLHEFREKHGGLPLIDWLRHLVVSQSSASWPLVIAAAKRSPTFARAIAIEVEALRRAQLRVLRARGVVTEAELAQVTELRAELEKRRLLVHLPPFVEKFEVAGEGLAAHPELSGALAELRNALFGTRPLLFADAVLLVLLGDDADRIADAEMERFARRACEDPVGLRAAYRGEIDEAVRQAAEAPCHCAYRYKGRISSEAYLGRFGVIACLQRKDGGFRVSTCYRSDHGRTSRERSIETARAFLRKKLESRVLYTREAWGEPE